MRSLRRSYTKTIAQIGLATAAPVGAPQGANTAPGIRAIAASKPHSRLAPLLRKPGSATVRKCARGPAALEALPFRTAPHYNARSFRADSSAGRALRSQCRGREFDPPSVHQEFQFRTAHHTAKCRALFCFRLSEAQFGKWQRPVSTPAAQPPHRVGVIPALLPQALHLP